MEEKPSFLRDHADTVAIIGVNIAIAGFILSLIFSNMANIDALNSRVDVSNARSDALYTLCYDLLKEIKGR